ncbi:integrin alpha [Actinocorallia populi]|uniref:integrin alpha n=1 Tax=Actinocorallia populi TaxID=2079200 RepID=UPI000D091CA4|nr:FG-GAP repeat protein [Actinocorallia populi]
MKRRRLTWAGVLGGCALLGGAFLMPPQQAGAASCDQASRADFDGDGKDDFVVGDAKATFGDAVSAGQVTVHYGGDRPGRGRLVPLRDDEPQAGAGFGHAVATGHLNGDKCLDLVVGSPWAEEGAGRARIFLGSPQGLRSGAVLEPPRTTRTFGWSVATAAKTGADRAAVVVGAPYEEVAGRPSAGAVYLFSLDDQGAVAGRAAAVDQDDDRLTGVSEAGDLFGWAVALGKIRGEAERLDLIVSEPGEDVEGQGEDAGSFSVAEDITTGRVSEGEHWHYGNLEIGDPTPGGNIGWSLAHLEEGGTSYVAVGAPGQTVDGKERAGRVALLTSTGAGLGSPQVIEQNRDKAPYIEAGDRYGRSLALAGDGVTGDGVQLAVGVPHDGPGTGSTPESGWVHLVPLAQRDRALLIDALNSDVPGDPGAYEHFGRSVAFTTGALLIGVPDDRSRPGGSLIVRPLGDEDPVQLVPDSEYDETDFGGTLGGAPG